MGDFNARPSPWCSDDINNTEVKKLLSLTSYSGFRQIINESTLLKSLFGMLVFLQISRHMQTFSEHLFLRTPLVGCFCWIDLIITDQPNLSVNSRTHTSLHPNCHYQIVQPKFDLNIFYSLPYHCLVRDYKKADAYTIQKALDLVNWGKLFSNKSRSSMKQF